MRPLDVVVPEPWAKGERPTPRAGIRDPIGPAANQCLNEAFGLPVGLGVTRSAADQPDARAVRDVSEHGRAIGTAIVGQDPFDGHAATSKPAHGPTEECRGGPAALIGQDLHVRDTAVIVDGDMRVLVAGALDFLSAIAVNAMPDAKDPRRAA